MSFKDNCFNGPFILDDNFYVVRNGMYDYRYYCSNNMHYVNPQTLKELQTFIQ